MLDSLRTRLSAMGIMGRTPDILDVPVIPPQPRRGKGRPRTARDGKATRHRREYAVRRYYSHDIVQIWATFRLTRLRTQARQQQVAIDLTKDDLIELLRNSGMRCPVFDSPMEFARGCGVAQFNAPSVRRLNEREPYTKLNMVVISTGANKALAGLNLEQAVMLGQFAQAMLCQE